MNKSGNSIKVKKLRLVTGIAASILALGCIGCGENKDQTLSGETKTNADTITVMSETKTEATTEATTEAPTESVTETKEYTLEDAKTDVIWHFKRLDDWMNGTYFVNDSECKTDNKGYYITIRYKLGRGEINTGYGDSNNIYIASVFVEKDTKMMEYLDAESPFYVLTKGKKVQL